MPVGSLALSMHSPSGSVPAAIGMQVPSVPGELQLPHLSQLMLQQTPSLQRARQRTACCACRRAPSGNAGGHCDAAPPSAGVSGAAAVVIWQ